MIVGIDLAASVKRDTGICVISKGKTTVKIVHEDDGILELIKKFKPKIVGIDAPLSIPESRKSIEDNNGVHFRGCDLELRKLGIRFFPITLGPMRMLTKRGMELKKKILEIDSRIEVIEVYPGATYDIFNINRKNKEQIIRWTKKYIKIQKREYTQDELDGICCAITSKLFLEKKGRKIGKIKEGTIIIPNQTSSDE